MPKISGHELVEMKLHIGTLHDFLPPPVFYFCEYQGSDGFR